MWYLSDNVIIKSKPPTLSTEADPVNRITGLWVCMSVCVCVCILTHTHTHTHTHTTVLWLQSLHTHKHTHHCVVAAVLTHTHTHTHTHHCVVAAVLTHTHTHTTVLWLLSLASLKRLACEVGIVLSAANAVSVCEVRSGFP